MQVEFFQAFCTYRYRVETEHQKHSDTHGWQHRSSSVASTQLLNQYRTIAGMNIPQPCPFCRILDSTLSPVTGLSDVRKHTSNSHKSDHQRHRSTTLLPVCGHVNLHAKPICIFICCAHAPKIEQRRYTTPVQHSVHLAGRPVPVTMHRAAASAANQRICSLLGTSKLSRAGKHRIILLYMSQHVLLHWSGCE